MLRTQTNAISALRKNTRSFSLSQQDSLQNVFLFTRTLHPAAIEICVRDNPRAPFESETSHLQLLFRNVMRLKPPTDNRVVSWRFLSRFLRRVCGFLSFFVFSRREAKTRVAARLQFSGTPRYSR